MGRDRWIRNGGAITGLVAIGVGCWQVSPAAAWIIIGVVLFAGSICGMILSRPRKNTRR